jgi:hypothetical protein
VFAILCLTKASLTELTPTIREVTYIIVSFVENEVEEGGNLQCSFNGYIRQCTTRAGVSLRSVGKINEKKEHWYWWPLIPNPAKRRPQPAETSPLYRWFQCNFPPKRRFTQDLHGVTSQKTAFFIVTAVETSNLTWTKFNFVFLDLWISLPWPRRIRPSEL